MNKTDLKAALARWNAPGSKGFFNFIDDVQPKVPSHKGGFEVYKPEGRIRDEIAHALDNNYRVCVFSFPRRHGKTVVTAMIIVWRFLSRRTQTIAVVGNSEKQSVDMALRMIRTIVEQTPFIKRLIDAGAIEVGADWITYPALGNRIQGYSNKPQSLYGRKISIAQVSELHAATSDATYQVLASSTIDSEDGLVLVDSTVGSRNSPLYTLYDLHQRGADPTLYYAHLEYKNLDDAIANGPAWINADSLRSRAAQMLPMEFAQQHLNQWSSGSNALFTSDQLAACTESYALDLPTLTAGRSAVCGAGLDRAYGFSMHGDSTVTTAVAKALDGDAAHYYVMDSADVAFSSERGIKSNLTRYHRDYGIKRVTIESYNAQDVGAWCADQPFDHSILSATVEKQANIFSALYQLVSEKRLHIHPKFSKLLKELEVFEYRLESTGNGTVPKFSAPNKLHDDHIYSLAWAIYSLKDDELNAYELKGIACNATGPTARLCCLNGGDLLPMCADSCRSAHQARALYDSYLTRAGCAPMAFSDFFKSKVVNIGAHTVRR